MLQMIDCPLLPAKRGEEEEFSYRWRGAYQRARLDPAGGCQMKSGGDYLFLPQQPPGSPSRDVAARGGVSALLQCHPRYTVSYEVLETYCVGTKPGSTAASVSRSGSHSGTQTRAKPASATQAFSVTATDENGVEQ